MTKELLDAATFAGYGDYMRRKRAKLQIQNTEIDPAPKSDIMKGISIYVSHCDRVKAPLCILLLNLQVNGHTNPSFQELRRIIISHGGTFQPYLDRKVRVNLIFSLHS